MDTANLSALDLLRLIRLGHPDEKGEPYTRYEIMEEIEKRGEGILKELKWQSDMKSIYKNRYTGDEETLYDVISDEGYFTEHKLNDELPFVMENWAPKEFWTSEELFDEYKKNVQANLFNFK